MGDLQGNLIKGLKCNDSLAYEDLVNQYADRLLKIAYFIVKDHQLAEDVVQESFISLYKNIKSFKGESQLSTWLIRITINQAKRSIKPNWFKRVFFTNQIELVEPSHTPEEVVAIKEEEDSLKRALSKLALIYKEILYLFYFEEFKIKEIAEILNLGESTVKSRLKRGKEKLKEKIEEGGKKHE